MIEGSGFRAGSEPLTKGPGDPKNISTTLIDCYVSITIFLSKVKSGKLIHRYGLLASHLAFHQAWVLSEAALAYRSLAGNLHLVSRPSAIDCTEKT
jgi:hypothetical protein